MKEKLWTELLKEHPTMEIRISKNKKRRNEHAFDFDVTVVDNFIGEIINYKTNDICFCPVNIVAFIEGFYYGLERNKGDENERN